MPTRKQESYHLLAACDNILLYVHSTHEVPFGRVAYVLAPLKLR